MKQDVRHKQDAGQEDVDGDVDVVVDGEDLGEVAIDLDGDQVMVDGDVDMEVVDGDLYNYYYQYSQYLKLFYQFIFLFINYL